jgi:hypothetical protein
MSEFIKSFRKAEKLVSSKQNRENAIMLVGVDKAGNESFIQWITADSLASSLKIPKGTIEIRAQAGTKD